jgi:hypothetical protein
MNRKVRVGSKYVYDPVMMDVLNPPFGNPNPGDLVKVINKFGCPPANTMGMCYIEFGGIFMGMVCTNSLINQAEWKRRNK